MPPPPARAGRTDAVVEQMHLLPVFVMFLVGGLFEWDAGWGPKGKVALAVLWLASTGAMVLKGEAPRRTAGRRPPTPAWLVFLVDGLACIFLATGPGPRVTVLALAGIMAVLTVWFTMRVHRHAQQASSATAEDDQQP